MPLLASHYPGMHRAFHLSTPVIILSVALLAGCAKDQPPSGPTPPRRIGAVAAVNTATRFVVIDVGTLFSPPAGATLKTYRARTETSTLTVTPERKRPFIVADIVKGDPEKGDLVYQ
jgi:hypothetical protein